jgi:hypothetical protein
MGGEARREKWRRKGQSSPLGRRADWRWSKVGRRGDWRPAGPSHDGGPEGKKLGKEGNRKDEGSETADKFRQGGAAAVRDSDAVMANPLAEAHTASIADNVRTTPQLQTQHNAAAARRNDGVARGVGCGWARGGGSATPAKPHASLRPRPHALVASEALAAAAAAAVVAAAQPGSKQQEQTGGDS